MTPTDRDVIAQALERAEKATKGPWRTAHSRTDIPGLARIATEEHARAERLNTTLIGVISVIPGDFLQANDVPGTPGITAALDLVGAVRQMTEHGRMISARAREAAARAARLAVVARAGQNLIDLGGTFDTPAGQKLQQALAALKPGDTGR